MHGGDLTRKLTVLLSATLLISGVGLAAWAFTHMPMRSPADVAFAEPAAGETRSISPLASGQQSDNAETPGPRLRVALASGLPVELVAALDARQADGLLTTAASDDEHHLHLDYLPENGTPLYRQTFAATTRFDIVDPTIHLAEVSQSWQGEDVGYARTAILAGTLPALAQLFGQPGETVAEIEDVAALVDAAWAVTPTLVLLPFDLLTPRLATLAIDEQNPLENANRFDEAAYPLVATVYAHDGSLPTTDAAERAAIDALLAQLPGGNRDPERLTVVAMTGVTAMVRLTAAQMDRYGPAWAAELIGPELAAADITAISNEVPFLDDCVTDTRAENLVFCSKPEYLEALTVSGVDIVGLTGNHQNDFGREAALASLDTYEEAGLPIYGGGRNAQEAAAPHYIEHNGNRLAFLGANSFGPPNAWATDSLPGSAVFDLSILSAMSRNIKQADKADVVLVELQYEESYGAQPLSTQRQDFDALSRAGVDIVTGVQSHVPQAIRFLDSKLILYGLGNLYFDQMWSEPTRQGLVAKHTIYEGRHIGTQLLTTLLYEYGQPRPVYGVQRAQILERIFAYSQWE